VGSRFYSRRVAHDAPVVTLANAILLSALKKGAEAIWVGRDAAALQVRFRLGGVVHIELAPPLALHGPLVRRYAIMASLPTYPKGAAAEGEIVLEVGEHRARFAIRVEGHGPGLVADLRVLAGAA